MRSDSGQGSAGDHCAGDQTQDPRPAPSQGVGELVSPGSEPARSPKKYGTTISGEELLLRIYAGPDAVGAPKPHLDGKQSLLRNHVYVRRNGVSLTLGKTYR